MTNYHFGIEIEVIVEPHKIRPPLNEKHALYYEKLAAALRNRNLKAKADSLQNGYAKKPEHYDKWWITSDSSLGNDPNRSTKEYSSPLSQMQHFEYTNSKLAVQLEAVSPILTCESYWEDEIETFWTAMRKVFHMPDRSSRCGSHIHVSLGQGRAFSLPQLKTIAFGVVRYEPLILSLLKADRVSNNYCQPNTSNSTPLHQCGSNATRLAHLINGAINATELKNIMQNDRKVLWNFDNVVPGGSGTIEFRGGRGLRGEVRTKRWIACTIALIDFILTMVSFELEILCSKC